MTKALFLVMVCLVFMLLHGRTTTSHNHNGEHYGTLCDILAAAVQKWKSTNNPTAKKALSQAIFGHPNGKGDPSKLDLPSTHLKPGNRKNWCGECMYNDQESYPGKSIPHDLLCMCTVGENGYPFIQYSEVRQLCGKGAKELGCDKDAGNAERCHSDDNKHGWTESNWDGQANKHLNATWHAIVKACLRGKPKSDVDKARKTLQKLDVGEYSTPSWAWGHSGCAGGNSDVCVGYGSWCLEHPKEYPQWWKTLYEALNAPDLRKQNDATPHALTTPRRQR
ncbi:Variant surface glycoprotein [Trypanosoma congolense IL3000]|uniref:Variant surface glycoprotein n=1 Tax=Trypanosoma congolense (strain IL3000) TaxID=1068625 RepID=F9WJ71_TRYCI|nr:Variant surface glycoprotein [Trypanosoma congolense IL3000]